MKVMTVAGPEESRRRLVHYFLPVSSEEYRCSEPPRVVLDKLEKRGYRVVSMTGVGQTCIWTLHCEDSKVQ